MPGMDIKKLVADFNERLHALVDEISVGRAREAVMHALGHGRLPKGLAAIIGRKPRRKGPRQLCPVPGCRNPAAPVFGMLCTEHKDVSKRKIKQYREARRAAKLGARKGAQGHKPDGKRGTGKDPKKEAKGARKRKESAKVSATAAPRARRSKRGHTTRLAGAGPKKTARPAGDFGSAAAAPPSAPPPAAVSPSASQAN